MIIEEKDLISEYLSKFTIGAKGPTMIQIGANEGKYEYSKINNQDFIFLFLLKNPLWQAILIEPLPSIFKILKENYKKHRNELTFINCAVTERLEYKTLNVMGRDGKSSSFFDVPNKKINEKISVLCLPYEYICQILGLEKVDFIKIDTEGYDGIIVLSILRNKNAKLLPKIIMWEGDAATKMCEKILFDLNYTIHKTGLNKLGGYTDRVAIHNSIL